MTASDDQNPVLTVEFVDDQLPGTVRGEARILVRPAEHESEMVLRFFRYLARVSLLRCLDLAQDGTPLGPERDAVILPEDDPRRLECLVDLPPEAACREYRLEWELNPDDHPSIGEVNGEMLLFRTHVLTRGEDGAEQIRGQRIIRIRWVEELRSSSRSFHSWSTSPSTPEPLREALRALLRAEVQKPDVCAGCSAEDDLELFLAYDRVWECSAEPELEEVRRLVVLRELGRDDEVNFAGVLRTRHQHEDLSVPLAAARERHYARLLAYAPPGRAMREFYTVVRFGLDQER